MKSTSAPRRPILPRPPAPNRGYDALALPLFLAAASGFGRDVARAAATCRGSWWDSQLWSYLARVTGPITGRPGALRGGRTPLQSAAGVASPRRVAWLLERGANPNPCAAFCPPPLCAAARGGREQTVHLLLRAGATVSPASAWQPLVAAAAQGHHSVVLALLDAGAFPDAFGVGDWEWEPHTAVMAAILRGDAAMLSTLLARGADPCLPTPGGGVTPLHLAAAQGDAHVALTAALLGSAGGVDVDAVAQHFPEGDPRPPRDAKYDWYYGDDYDVRAEEALTPLVAALRHRAYAVATALLEGGAGVGGVFGDYPLADLGPPNEDEAYDFAFAKRHRLPSTALITAAAGGAEALVAAILASWGDPNQLVGAGWSALHAAARGGHAGVVRALLAAGAEVDVFHDIVDTRMFPWLYGRVHGGQGTPLSEAIRVGSVEVATALLDAGADPSLPLMIAAECP